MRMMFASIFFVFGCVDIHDNPIEANVDFCKAVSTIQSKSEEESRNYNDSDLIPEWGECEFNEECETYLCMCDRCIDIFKFMNLK